MSTCKALLSKITNKNAFYEQEDVTQNIFAFRVVGICILFYSFVMILNCLHIFIVDQAIFIRGYVVACVLALIYGLLLVKMGLEHPFTKYLSVTAIGLIVMVASASLTYHYYDDPDYHCKYVYFKETVGLCLYIYSGWDYDQYLCGLLFWGM